AKHSPGHSASSASNSSRWGLLLSPPLRRLLRFRMGDRFAACRMALASSALICPSASASSIDSRTSSGPGYRAHREARSPADECTVVSGRRGVEQQLHGLAVLAEPRPFPARAEVQRVGPYRGGRITRFAIPARE